MEGDAEVEKQANAPDQTVKLTPRSDLEVQLTGVMIGRYKLLQQIGEGGFGVVYMAEQVEPVRRKVALKIIKAGMDTKEIIARFEAERQALALMDHPNVARVLDAGATQAGRPYFVMELVRGVPITDYCDTNRLPPRARIDLFRKVCQAVQHAHQKGIVHRDLKPTNILVTVQDDAPLPKIIDFGVAKALQSSLTERTLFTRYNQWIGTPAYMSPEQASLGSLDVDTRSDIYSLGTILYELLTGHTPFDAQALREKGHDAILQTIREEDVPMASTRLSSLARDELQSIADHRSRTPEKLERVLKGELDWILLKALERNRVRRYETANALAKDLTRYCEGEPISAVPPSFVYQAGKFIRRYWRPVSLAATISVLVIAGAAVSAVLAVRAKRAEIEARNAESKAVASERETARKHYNASMLLARMNWDNHGVSIARKIIESLHPTEGAADHRGWEWYYMQSLLHQEIHVLENDGSPVFALAWSPDSRRIAAAGGDGVIRIWDPVSGNRVQQFGFPVLKGSKTTNEIRSMAWSPDGGHIYAGSSEGKVVGWNLATETRDFEVPFVSGSVTAVALNSENSWLAAATSSGVLFVWNVKTGKPVGIDVRHWRGIVSLIFSPNGKRLLSVHRNGTVAAWDLAGVGKLFEVTLDEPLCAAALSPVDEHLFVCGLNRRYCAELDSRTGQVIAKSRNNLDWSGDAIAVSPDGAHVCTAGGKGEILLRDSSLERVEWIYPGRNRDVKQLSYSPDGRWLASAGADGKVNLWDARRMREASVEIPLNNLYSTIRWSPVDDRLAIDEMMHYAKVVDSLDGSVICRLGPHHSRTAFVAWSHDGTRIATGGYFEPVKLWDASTGSFLRSLKGVFACTFDAVWSPNSSKLAALYTATATPVNQHKGPWKLCIWDADSGKLIHQMDGIFSAMKHMDWSCKDLLAVPCPPKKQVNIYDVVSGEMTSTLSVTNDVIRSVRWSPDGRFLAGGANRGALVVWDMATGRTEHVLNAHTDRIFDIAWSPDGTRIATASWDATVKIWNAQTGELVFLFRNPNQVQDRNKGFWTVDWSHDGTKLVTGSMDGYVRIYDASRGYRISGALPARPANELALPTNANLERKDQQ